jgi:hypothetical protein
MAVTAEDLFSNYSSVVSEPVVRDAERLLNAPTSRAASVTLLPKSLKTAAHQRSLLELEGLGREIWEGVDATEYVEALRREWDDP